jgi:simple sugar transport system permease protein
MRRRIVGAAVTVVTGVVFLFWYATTDTLPEPITNMTPYVTTLLVLAFASQRLRMPAADGLPYRRGQGG